MRARRSHLVWIRNVDGWHVETALVESRPLAELLDDLHHDSLEGWRHTRLFPSGISSGGKSPSPRRFLPPARYLSVGLSARLVGLAQVEAQPVPVRLVQALHDVEGALAKRLTHGVEEDEHEVAEVT